MFLILFPIIYNLFVFLMFYLTSYMHTLYTGSDRRARQGIGGRTDGISVQQFRAAAFLQQPKLLRAPRQPTKQERKVEKIYYILYTLCIYILFLCIRVAKALQVFMKSF